MQILKTLAYAHYQLELWLSMSLQIEEKHLSSVGLQRIWEVEDPNLEKWTRITMDQPANALIWTLRGPSGHSGAFTKGIMTFDMFRL